MIINTTAIIISAVLVLLAIVSCTTNTFFLIPLKKKMHGETNFDNAAGLGDEMYLSNPQALPPMSVVVCANDNIAALEENLPVLLSQDYPAGYQVIVVANEGDSSADDMIKRFSQQRHLKSTFIPASSRYVSREKLGITLGIKAADNEWCLLMDANCRPISTNWLREIGRECTSNHNLVLGYCNHESSARAYYRFSRLRHFANLWRESVTGTTFASNGSNMALRKSEFIKNDGYRGNLDIVRGEYDFIINKYARKGCTAFVTSEEGMLIEEEPYPRHWRRQQLYYLHSCRNMRRTLMHYLLPTLDTMLLHLSFVLAVVALAVGGMDFEEQWPLIPGAVVALAVVITWRTINGARAMRYFNTGIKKYQIIPLELSVFWHQLGNRLRYLFTNKYNFTCHKI